MVIAIDYDETYSVDPAAWDRCIAILKEHGHDVHCVTCRRETMDNVELCQVTGCMTFFTGLAPKRWYMDNRGIKIDVWIDDMPESVLHGR